MLTNSPCIVECHWRPKRSPKRRRPQPECARIIEIAPRKRVSTAQRGVPDDAQRSEIIQRYLAQLD